MAAKKVGVSCNGYSEVVFLFNRTDWREIPAKNVNQCALLKLNRRILKIFAYGVILPPKPPFWGCFDESPCNRATGQGLRILT